MIEACKTSRLRPGSVRPSSVPTGGKHVLAKFGRSVRVSLSQRKPTDTERKADDGPSRLVHLSVGNGESALPESTGPTEKRSARKRACLRLERGKGCKALPRAC